MKHFYGITPEGRAACEAYVADREAYLGMNNTEIESVIADALRLATLSSVREGFYSTLSEVASFVKDERFDLTETIRGLGGLRRRGLVEETKERGVLLLVRPK